MKKFLKIFMKISLGSLSDWYFRASKIFKWSIRWEYLSSHLGKKSLFGNLDKDIEIKHLIFFLLFKRAILILCKINNFFKPRQ